MQDLIYDKALAQILKAHCIICYWKNRLYFVLLVHISILQKAFVNFISVQLVSTINNGCNKFDCQ